MRTTLLESYMKFTPFGGIFYSKVQKYELYNCCIFYFDKDVEKQINKTMSPKSQSDLNAHSTV